MEEKRNITSGDKIPGCERLTRPEEIKGLSKYLGAIRKTQEQWISENMPDSPLESPIEDKVSDLPKKKETIHIQEPKELPSDYVGISVPKDKLKTDKVKLSISQNPELPKTLDKIHINEPQELPGDIVGIDVPEDKLRQGIEKLVVSEEPSLPEIKVSLSDDRNLELPKESAKIYPQAPILKTGKERLVVSDVLGLPEGVIGLAIGKDPNLPKEKIRVAVTEPEELPKTSESIYPEEPKSLSNYLERLIATEPDDLRQKKESLSVGEIDSLPEEMINLSVSDLSKLPKDRLDIYPEETTKLPKDRLDLYPEEPTKLPNSKIGIYPNELKSLPDSLLKISKEDIEELPNDRVGIDVEDPERIDRVLESMSGNELYEEVMKLLKRESGKHIEGTGNLELAGIISAYLGSDNISTERASEAAGKIATILEKQKKLLSVADPNLNPKKDTLPEGSRRKLVGDKELYKESSRLEMPEYKTPNGESFTETSNFFNYYSYDQDRYIRRLAEIAANAAKIDPLNGPVSSALRKNILQQTLRALVYSRSLIEKAAGIDRGRLPGSLGRKTVQDIAQGGFIERISNDVESELRKIHTAVKGVLFESGSHNYPENRPAKNSDGTSEMANSSEVFDKTFYEDDNRSESFRVSAISDAIEQAKETIASLKTSIRDTKFSSYDISNIQGWKYGSGVSQGLINSANEIQKVLDKEEAKLEYLKRKKDLFNSGDYSGIYLTLHDLCPNVNPDEVSNMEDLKKALVDSPYITTPWKLIKSGNNATLDNNAYWELIIEPYLETNENGGFSFLPSIKEVNYENKIQHGHNTLYSKWIPISNFELQKTKLVSKSLGLFDGEINYPVSVEYTNELRITVVDDQYKSWRRYFKKCADASIFFSEAHNADYYKITLDSILPTAIDKSKICAAYYKNITFNIKIYCMTPQYSTIKKFDLLCVMKDFSDDWMGEIEGGGMDLSISFSVVGENPPTNLLDVQEVQKPEKDRKEQEKQQIQASTEEMEKQTFSQTMPAKSSNPKEYDPLNTMRRDESRALTRIDREFEESIERQEKELFRNIDDILKDQL